MASRKTQSSPVVPRQITRAASVAPVIALGDAKEPEVITSQVAGGGLHRRAGPSLVFPLARMKTLFLGSVPSARLNILVRAVLPGLFPPAPPSVPLALLQRHSCPEEPKPVPSVASRPLQPARPSCTSPSGELSSALSQQHMNSGPASCSGLQGQPTDSQTPTASAALSCPLSFPRPSRMVGLQGEEVGPASGA